MKHIVKISLADMASEDAWRELIFQLDPAAHASDVLDVQLNVETVFFHLST